MVCAGQPAAQLVGAGALELGRGQRAEGADEVAIGHAAGAGRLAGQAAQAAVNVRLGGFPREAALQRPAS